jgi:hypothetical protein
LASAGWALQVWIFGEALGGMLGPDPSILFGAPGAALVYCAAGVLIALPERCWLGQRLGLRTLRITGACLAGFAVLQAWPGHGFWQGRRNDHLGRLAAMVKSMAGTRQPVALERLVSGFGSIAANHGFAVNLTVVLVLAGAGGFLLTGRRALIRPAVVLLLAFFLVDWVLVQDLGFLGGLGTDPNSMVPLSLLVLGAFMASVMVAEGPATAGTASAQSGDVRAGERQHRPGARLAAALGTSPASAVVALWGVGVIALGAAPMAVAETTRPAGPVAATSLVGPAETQAGKAVALLATRRGESSVEGTLPARPAAHRSGGRRLGPVKRG